MSHDLYFALPTGAHLDDERLASVLARQRYWTRSAAGWWYGHPDTGVYGSLERAAPFADVPAGFAGVGLLVNLNYARPSFFARELLPFVVELAEATGLLVIDPQDHEIGGAARPKRPVLAELIATWDRGNALAIGVGRSSGRSLPPMPRAHALSWWSYMRRRADVQAVLGERAYAAALQLAHRPQAGRVVRVLTWVVGNPAVLPEADVVALLEPDPTKEFTMRGATAYARLIAALGEFATRDSFGVPDLAPQPFVAPDRAAKAAEIARRLETEPLVGFEGVRPDGSVDPE